MLWTAPTLLQSSNSSGVVVSSGQPWQVTKGSELSELGGVSHCTRNGVVKITVPFHRFDHFLYSILPWLSVFPRSSQNHIICSMECHKNLFFSKFLEDC